LATKPRHYSLENKKEKIVKKGFFSEKVASNLNQDKGSLLGNKVTLSRLWTPAGSIGSTCDKGAYL